MSAVGTFNTRATKRVMRSNRSSCDVSSTFNARSARKRVVSLATLSAAAASAPQSKTVATVLPVALPEALTKGRAASGAIEEDSADVIIGGALNSVRLNSENKVSTEV